MRALSRDDRDDAPEARLEAALNAWLRDEVEVDRPRRIVRADATRILVSKFEPGFAARLHELLDLMPELFDARAVADAYARRAAEVEPGTPRTRVWHETMHALLRDAGARHAIPDLRQAEVRTGIDSVYAVLQSVLWSDPAVGDAYAPQRGEMNAYRDGLRSLDPSRDLFTRHYGVFDDRAVVNYCPGAALARTMLGHAWAACTGEPPPTL
ncbi:MAG: hypothetical protein FJZ92_01095 [Chloroflexi bacterium]|nr:hypothetical protein [Chloroflexota bacterium]